MCKRTTIIQGQKFGRLTATKLHHLTGKAVQWWTWTCDCGQTIVQRAAVVVGGHTSSCGCYRKEVARELMTTHSGRDELIYETWASMRARCNNPNHAAYPNYGGRGIVVDPRWDSFENFRIDMGPKPTPEHTLDRQDNDGPYSPDNCRWATRSEQSYNSSRSKFYNIPD